MWTPLIVRARFIEAADIERRMVVKDPGGGGGGYWPSFDFDEEDRKGWVQADIDEAKARWAANKSTLTPEVTRWEEVFFIWSQLIPESRRLLVWRWAQCIAGGRSFVAYCEKKGLNRRTAYLRLDRVWDMLATRFRNEGLLLRRPDEKWDSQQEPSAVEVSATIRASVSAKQSNRHGPFISEKSTDTLKTPAAVAAFVAHLEDANEARRKARVRRLNRAARAEADAA